MFSLIVGMAAGLLLAPLAYGDEIPLPPEPYLSAGRELLARGEVTILTLRRPYIDWFCYGRELPSDRLVACARIGGRMIYVADDIPADVLPAVLAHEVGHSAGWPADHPA